MQSINDPNHPPDGILAQGGEVGDAATQLLKAHVSDAGVRDVHRAEGGADGVQHLPNKRT